jgi:Uma2 family endonuclease
LGADEFMVNTPTSEKISFEEYLQYDDGTNALYELVNGELLLMPPASFLHSDIVDFIADLIKAVARDRKLDIKVKTGDVGVRTSINSSRIPDLVVIDGQVWKSYRRDRTAVIEGSLLLAVEVVSPGTEQIERDYIEKVADYQNARISEYWIVDPIERKISVLVLEKDEYSKTVFTGDDGISSVVFPQLNVTTSEILSA